MGRQIELTDSRSPTSESFSEFSEKRQTSSATFHDILPPHCITTADRSAKTYYGQPKFNLKSGIRRFTAPATSTTVKIDVTERQKQAESSSAIRRSTMRSLMKEKSSKKDGPTILSKLFSRSSKKRDEGDRKDTLYEYDSDDKKGMFEEYKASL